VKHFTHRLLFLSDDANAMPGAEWLGFQGPREPAEGHNTTFN
jgi:hypothetical protein